MGDDGHPEAATGPAQSVGNAGALEATVRELEASLAETKKELAMRVKHYEAKLVTMTVINSALQSENDKLKEAVQESSLPSNADQELKELQEEFTKRLGVAEKTASVMKEECFGLRKEVDELKKTKVNLNNQLTEKVKAIEQYKGEGDNLARKMGELESVVKKLRSDVARLEQEKEKSQARVQILEAATKSVEASRSASLEEANQTLAATRLAMAEQKEHFSKLLQEAQKQREEELAKAREESLQQTSRSAKETQQKEELLSASLDALRQSLAKVNQEASEREDKLREEISQLEARNRATEMAQEEAAGRVTEATRPLIRQMEGMSAHISRLEAAVQERERQLQQQLGELERAQKMASEVQKRADSSSASAERRAEMAEKVAADARAEAMAAQHRLKEDEGERKALREQFRAALEQATVAEEGQREAMLALASAREQKEAAERALEVKKLELKAELEEEKRRIEQDRAGLERRERELVKLSSSPGSLHSSRQNSGKESNGWQEEDLSESRSRATLWDESAAASWKAMSLSGSGREAEGLSASSKGGGGAVAMERLLAKVKQQGGEIAHLQKELMAAKSAREHAADELLKVSEQLHSLRQESSRAPQIAKELEELKKRHDMALVIIGERNEKAEELEADLADVKALYREQMNFMVNEIDPEKWPNGYRICLFCSHCSQVQRSRKRGNS